MKNPFQSIRWRLQAWHGLMLLLVLAAFGATAWYLVRDNRLRRVDAELQRHAFPMIGMLNRFGGPPGDRGPGRFRPGGPDEQRFLEGKRGGGMFTNDVRPEEERRREAPRPPETGPETEPKPERPRPEGGRPDWWRSGDARGPEGFRMVFVGNFPLPPDVQRAFDDTGPGGYYFVIWSPEREELRRSTNAPLEIPIPEVTASETEGRFRTRAGFREFAQVTRRGSLVLVGHDITPDLAELNQLAWLLAAAGGGVLALGLAGGWWLSTRAIAPIAVISGTANKIAGGNLAERINVKETDSELGQLAKVLNTTFDRLQAAFERQIRFTADASHELRTPVSVVLSQTQTALKRERAPAEYRETIESCQRAAQRMRQLVESLLMLARLDSGEASAIHEPCHLDRVTAEAVELLKPLATEQDVKLHIELAPAQCRGDASQLAQAVTNLVSNAIYYNKPGGEVRVRVAADKDSVSLTVADTGVGISAEDLPHIFERFYRADKSRTRAQGRTGLGLAITEAIVKSHRGAITVTSEPGKGSAFTVRLPA